MKKSRLRLFSWIVTIATLSVFCFTGCEKDNKHTMTTYYIDPISGSDTNNGKSEKSAFRSLNAVSDLVLEGGDTLSLKGGTTLIGRLSFKGSGKPGNPIKVTSYGEGRATVDGRGRTAAVLLDGQSHVTVENLSVKNTDEDNIGGRSMVSGIAVFGNEGIVSDITIRNCIVSDVHGSVYGSDKYQNAGIHFRYTKQTAPEECFKNILVENCTLRDIYGTGLNIRDSSPWGPENDSMNPPQTAINPYSTITVRKTLIERTGGDGMILGCTDRPLVEDVKCYDAGIYSDGSTYSICGIWTHASFSPTFRRCEVARTRFIELDGQAFDTDWGNTGTVTWEYCYTHDNEGGLLLRHKSVDCVMRYCVSVNDGKQLLKNVYGEEVDPRGLIWHASVDDGYNSELLRAYNCVFYADNFDVIIARGPYWGSNGFLFNGDYDSSSNTFTNCAFITRNPVAWGKKMQLTNNLYFVLGESEQSKPERDINGIAVDPMFIGTVKKTENGMIPDGGDPREIFLPQSGSPLIGAGAKVENNGGIDYSGVSLGEKVCIGAFEREEE